MCGIAGFVGAGDPSDVVRMTRSLQHRGPDGEGFFFSPETGVFLGHRRLAVLDLQGGVQPMWNEDETVAVVFNGEIYNFRELRRDLEVRGHRFRTDHSDTEILVHGYEEWGNELPAKLNGMFAFAIYDSQRARLFLARDRFGEKPLYYALRPGFFAFASELGALIRHPQLVNSGVSAKAIMKYFAYGYIPAPNALYENCSKLPGGCYLTLDLSDKKPVLRRYWSFRVTPDDSLTEKDDNRLAEELRALLSTAVSRRLVSDVPLGIFLSGGLDSSAILANAARHLPRDRIHTFTIGFTEPSFDESQHARFMADTVGVGNFVETLDLDGAVAVLPSILSSMSEPLGDPSLLPTFLLSRFARERITVALSGDGGDELFAGYDPFKALSPALAYEKVVPRYLHGLARRFSEKLPLSHRNMSFDFKVRRFLTGLSYAKAFWNPVWLSALEPSAIRDLFHSGITDEELYEEAMAVWNSGQSTDIVDRSLDFFTNFYLQDGILTKVDRASMMCSLETRAVFLDNDVVDFCQKLPSMFKIRNGQRKFLLRKALEHDIPADVLMRRKKGFGIPLSRWLKSMERPAERIPGADSARAENLWRSHQNGKSDHRLFLWGWIALSETLASRSPSKPF